MNTRMLIARDRYSGISTLVRFAGLVALILLLISSSISAQSAADATGTISGTVVDAETGEVMTGVTVAVKGTRLGAITDLNGNYTIRKVPVGTYTLIASMVGFTSINVTDVVVTADATNTLALTLSSQAINLETTVRVTAKAVKNTEASLLKQRSAATSVSDAISAEQIKKSGAGDAADAMTRVTGASTTGGKFVYVRGLGDRYVNFNMNGSALPSPDPDKQAVPLDLIPAGLLDNIVVSKTFTPDKPGNFTGGSVNLATRDFPEERQLTFSTGIGWSSGNTFLTNPNTMGWLATTDDVRELPSYVLDNGEVGSQVPEGITFLNGTPTPDTLAIVDYMSNAGQEFDTDMTPERESMPLDQKYAVSYGDQFRLFDRPLGVIASLSYNRKARAYNDGVSARWRLVSSGNLAQDNYLTEDKGTEEVLWGGLVNMNYTLHKNHNIGFNYIRNQSGESTARYLDGKAYEINNDTANADFRTRVMQYTERVLTSAQVSGEHLLGLVGSGVRFEWQASMATTTQDDPDYRLFADEQTVRYEEDEDTGDLVPAGTAYQINPSAYRLPTRMWRELEEKNRGLKGDFIIPLGRVARFKTGASYVHKTREQIERQFAYANVSKYNGYDGDIDAYTAEQGLDTMRVLNEETGRTQWVFKNYISENREPQNNYEGTQNVFATYAMIDMPLFRRIRLVGGARLETTDMQTETGYTELGGILGKDTLGTIDEQDVLPSAGLIYSLTNNMNIRTSYGRTLARPNLREMSGSFFEEFAGGRLLIGNPELERTLVDNYDVRYEWFIRPGEILALSGFYKHFTNPIEEVIIDVNGNISWDNVDKAEVYGVELEFRRRLDHVHPSLRYFRLGGNLTLVHSEVGLTEDEIADAFEVIADTRPMAGQSPYIMNFDVSYDNPMSGTSFTLLYNRFGERLSFNSEDATPDIYEQGRDQVDFISSQRIFRNATLKFSVKNILNEEVKYTQEYQGLEYISRLSSPGRSVSLGVSYSL